MRCKVFVETSVLVGASVHASSDQIGIIEDQFYRIANSLFKVLKEHVKEKIGITTSTVEEEARSVLNSVVLRRFNRKTEETPSIRKSIGIFDFYSTILDMCTDNLSNNVAILLREPIPDEEKAQLVLRVGKMYREALDLLQMLKFKPKPTTGRLKKLAKAIYKSQLEQQLAPILRFIERRPPSTTDYEILAEAAYLADSYGSEFTFYLASTDQHFAPFKRKEKALSQRIQKEFGIICDWPNIIVNNIQSQLKT